MKFTRLISTLFLMTAFACPALAEDEMALDEELLKMEASGNAPAAETNAVEAAIEEAPVSNVAPSTPKSSAAAEDDGLKELEDQMGEEPAKQAEPKAAEAKPSTEEDEELNELGKELEEGMHKLPPPLPGKPVPKPAGPTPAKAVAERVVTDPERTVVCCKVSERYPARYGSQITYDLKRMVDCVDTDKNRAEIDRTGHACREEMKCCELPNLGHVYSVDCQPEQVVENTQKCEDRRMKKRMKVCCVTVQDDGWIAVEGWLQRKRCHQREGQMMSLPQELCDQLKTEDRPQ